MEFSGFGSSYTETTQPVDFCSVVNSEWGGCHKLNPLTTLSPSKFFQDFLGSFFIPHLRDRKEESQKQERARAA